jgi:tRNA (mo5U34)-methyltransferase
MPDVIDPAQLQAEVDSFPWYHSIDLGHGVTTKGQSIMAEMLTDAQLPDFRGRSVLDIGAWDGYYSFLAERRGASRVVALDHYAWGVDFAARTRYWDECVARGVLPDHARDTTDFWRDDLPGRRGFDLAHRVLESRVETVVADFTTCDLAALGSFDVVLYLGVLYHMKEPLTCFERLRAVTSEVAVVETVAMQIPGHSGRSLLELHGGGELNADFGNWYVPTVEALGSLARASGFSRVDVKRGPPHLRTRGRVARRLHLAPSDPDPAAANYRAVIHAVT